MVTFKRLQVGIELPEAFPQGLKPTLILQHLRHD
jgi:hypothetical protein